MNYVDLVDIQMGTNSNPTFSRGNTAPLVAHPFGMASFAIETREAGFGLFFHPDDHTSSGVRLTHLPSPHIGDYAYLTVMPQTGEQVDLTQRCKSGYRRHQTVMHPYQLEMSFLRYRAHLELVPTMRGGAFCVTWDQSDVMHRLALHFGKGEATVRIDPETNRIYGTVSTHIWTVPDHFRMYFVLEADRPFDLAHTVAGHNTGERFEDALAYSGENMVLNLAFAKDGSRQVHFTVATSFISFEQAVQNARRELQGKSMAQLKQIAVDAWEEKLSKIEIDGVDTNQLKTFYSCMYRMFLFPRVFHELDAEGNMIHYSPADGKVYDGPMYTDNGFFDTYMTVYPLFSLILKDEYALMCRGFLNYYKESGWLPRWMSPAALDSMPGTFIDQVFADAVAKGIVTDDETVQLMLESTVKHANVPADEDRYGRDGIEAYLWQHYLPSTYRESVNKTQNYAYGDFSIAVLARHLGMMDVYHTYMERSQYYRTLFDPQTGFMRGKDTKGKMRDDWTQFDWGWDYTEGGPWQNSFAVPHDIVGLAALHGGKEKLLTKLDLLFSTPPYYNPYWYGHEIHEMTEMAAVDFGQCALSNQPSFYIPYFYSMLGRPDKTSYWVRKAVNELFHWQVGFPGDEDNGSMAGWYIFSTMGFYPVCPSVPEYVLGSPAAKRCVIHTHAGTDFVINANNNDRNTYYWHNPMLNGAPYDKVYLNHEDVIKGGWFDLTMTSEPVEREYSDEALPYSVSRNTL